MASTGGGKMRPKRSHGANKPYQRTRPKSFLDRVKDMVTPSWLSNMWASSPPEESSNQQQHTASSTNSIPQRQTVSPDERYFNPIEIDMVQDSEPRPFRTGVQRVTEEGVTTPVLTPFAGLSVPVSTSTPVDVDEDDEVIEIDVGEGPSTQKDDVLSVVSSLYPNLDKLEHQEKLSDSNLDVLSDLGHRSTPRPSTSLWSHTPSGRQATTRARPAPSSLSRPQQPAISTRKPSFNTSYFGTPRGSVKTTMDTSTSSPFYPGRTTFGGSSSLRSTASKRPRTSPYEVHLPIKRSVRPRLVKPADGSNMGITSNTAKRILDTLEKMSTPLSDAKRIPLSPSSTPLAFTASRTPRPRPAQSPQRSVGLSHSSVRIPGPPVSGYNTPRTVSITPNRQPPLATSTELPKNERPSTSKATQEKTVISNPQSSVPVSTPAFTGFSFKPNTQTSSSPAQSSLFRVDTTPEQSSSLDKGSSGGKMKMPKRSSMHYSSHKDEDDVIEVPDLPNIPLPLGSNKSLPSFNFGKPLLPAKQTTSSFSTPPAAAASVPSQGFNIVTSKPAVSVPATAKNDEQEFTFASPILRQSSSTISAPEIETTEAFTFSLPKKADAFPSPPSTQMNFMKSSSSSQPPQTSSFMAKSPVKTPPRDHQSDEEDRGGFGIKPAKTLKTGSCLEVFGLVPSSDQTSMEATTETLTTSSNNTISAFAEKFKPPPGSWECDTCLIQNKADDNKCISCQTAKPQMVNSHAIPSSSSSSDVNAMNDLQARFKPPEGSWECPTCEIQNKQDVNKCVACMTPNPDSSTKAAPVTTNSLMDSFKPPSGSWECDTCLVENNAEAIKCVACTTAKPGVAGSNNLKMSSNTPLTNSNSGSWHCASCPEKNNSDVLKCNGCGVLKPTSNSTDSLMDKFRPPTGSWTCVVCMITNKESTDRCIACTAPKPGSQPSLNTPPASVFKLGSQSSSSTSSTAGDFQFGGTTSSVNFGAAMSKGFSIPTGGVTFGSQKADTGLAFGSQKDGPTSGFQFGSNSEEKTNSLPAASTVQFGSVKTSKTDSGFSFGAPTPSTASSTTKEDKPAVGASFQFGAAATTTTTTKADATPPNVDPFKSAEPSKTAFGAGGQMVNATPTSTQETDNKAQPKAVFSFGGNKAETSTINFGAAVTEQKQTSTPNTTFAFGAKAPATDNNPPKSQSTFNFSASSNPPTTSESQQSTGKTVFKFGGTPSDTKDEPKPPSSSAGFSFGNTSNAVNKTTQPTPHQNSMPPAYQFGQSNAGSDEAGTGAPLAKRGATFGSSVKPASAPESKASFSFGGTPSQTAPQQPSTTFVFGASENKVETQSKANGGITFGTPSQSATTSQPSDQFTFGAATNSNKTGGFNFSASANPTAAPAAATGGFQFRAGASITKPKENAPPAYGAFGGSNATSSTVFGAFGAPATTNSTPNPFGGQQPSQAVAPTFGTPSSSSVFGSVAAATPAFGTVASANNSRSSTPTFGATGGNAAPGFGSSGTTVPAFGAGATNSGIGFQAEAAAPAGFNYGANNATSTVPGLFAFGAANNNAAQSTAAAPQSTGGFNFGGQQQQQQQPSGFGAQNTTGAAGSTPGVFAFGGNQAPAASSFSFGQAGSQQQQPRKIRKAVRRTRKT
ncbi:uncharacterized protein [Asterias amurensis]|uniref:uncharacterized protein n=1 Tax=Asterias amurensis TaxID=7602 RepID=UPI003AB26B9C